VFFSMFNMCFFLVMIVSDSSSLRDLISDLIRNIFISFNRHLFIDDIINIFNSFNRVLFLSLNRYFSSSRNLNMFSLHLADHINSLLLDHFDSLDLMLFRNLLFMHFSISFLSVSGYWLLMSFMDSFRNIIKYFLSSDMRNMFNLELEMIMVSISDFLLLCFISSMRYLDMMNLLNRDLFSDHLSVLLKMMLLSPMTFSDLRTMRKHSHLLFTHDITMSGSRGMSHVHRLSILRLSELRLSDLSRAYAGTITSGMRHGRLGIGLGGLHICRLLVGLDICRL